MQEDLLQPKMTVYENMKIATYLKLGTTVPKRDKYRKVSTFLLYSFLLSNEYIIILNAFLKSLAENINV